jgi:hypothetical protein
MLLLYTTLLFFVGVAISVFSILRLTKKAFLVRFSIQKYLDYLLLMYTSPKSMEFMVTSIKESPLGVISELPLACG